jgi:hypothetical protein
LVGVLPMAAGDIFPTHMCSGLSCSLGLIPSWIPGRWSGPQHLSILLRGYGKKSHYIL